MSENKLSLDSKSGGVPKLARHIGLLALIAYGVGDMVGAGIYGTVGKAADKMGNAVWMAFAGSMIAALLTGLSYASLASRYPRAAGAAFVTQHAYRIGFLSYVVGFTVIASGLTSMATSCNVFASNLAGFVERAGMVEGKAETRPATSAASSTASASASAPATASVTANSTAAESAPVEKVAKKEAGTPWTKWTIMLLFLALLTFINFWGIRESMWTNALCMAVEVGGLIFVIAVGMKYWGSVDYMQTPTKPGVAGGGVDLWLIMSGAVLTFFSFIGFEDMLNVGEEVKNPRKTMPWGIVMALVVTTVLYMLISITAVSVVDYKQLANEKFGPPLQQITNKAAPWLPTWVFGAITLFAVANTTLINFIMGSRLVYGMSRQGLLPSALGKVHHKRQTPHVAIFVLLVIALVLAFAGDITQLALATSLLLLMVFCVVNSALVVLKYRKGESKGGFEIPVVVPILGALACAGLIVAQMTRLIFGVDGKPGDWKAPIIAGGLVLFISILYFVVKPKAITEEMLAEAKED